MSTTIQFKHNKSFAYIITIGLCLFFLTFFLLGILNKSSYIKSTLTFSSIIPLVFLLYFRKMFFIPTIKNEAALELNKDEIIYPIRRQHARWGNVKNIRQVSFKNSLGIAVELIDKNEFMQDKNSFQKIAAFFSNISYGTPFVISLQYIAGTDKEIFETVKNYFEAQKTNSLSKNFL